MELTAFHDIFILFKHLRVSTPTPAHPSCLILGKLLTSPGTSLSSDKVWVMPPTMHRYYKNDDTILVNQLAQYLIQNEYLVSSSYYDLTIFLEWLYMYIVIRKCSMRGKECTVNRKVKPLGSSWVWALHRHEQAGHSTCLMILSLSHLPFLPSSRLWTP